MVGRGGMGVGRSVVSEDNPVHSAQDNDHDDVIIPGSRQGRSGFPILVVALGVSAQPWPGASCSDGSRRWCRSSPESSSAQDTRSLSWLGRPRPQLGCLSDRSRGEAICMSARSGHRALAYRPRLQWLQRFRSPSFRATASLVDQEFLQMDDNGIGWLRIL